MGESLRALMKKQLKHSDFQKPIIFYENRPHLLVMYTSVFSYHLLVINVHISFSQIWSTYLPWFLLRVWKKMIVTQ